MFFRMVVFTVIMLLAGCTLPIKRMGYTYNYDKAESDCDVRFEKNATVDSKTEKVVGTVIVSDDIILHNTCLESDVIKVLNVEACVAGANIVNIIDEKQPDSSNCCYRVNALLIRRASTYTSVPQIASEKNKDTSEFIMKTENIKDADKTDSLYTAKMEKNEGVKALTGILGFLVGIGLLSLMSFIFLNNSISK